MAGVGARRGDRGDRPAALGRNRVDGLGAARKVAPARPSNIAGAGLGGLTFPSRTGTQVSPCRGNGAKRVMSESGPRNDKSPSELIDERIAELRDWRGETLARVRALIREA